MKLLILLEEKLSPRRIMTARFNLRNLAHHLSLSVKAPKKSDSRLHPSTIVTIFASFVTKKWSKASRQIKMNMNKSK